ncbi:hypothetical protein [Hyalangium versicolor]|uniref:hypothetical protein n=1 Tax=Hyalangium versicolor TaxID=2861190 RepID=UPI001CCC9654|nr:hypothetical protein [Hyalangium versicolor]
MSLSVPDALPGFIIVLQKATALFEEEARARLTTGHASLFESIQHAKDFYARAARAKVRTVRKMEPGAVAEIEVTSWFQGKVVDSKMVYFFEGPLTGHDDFQRIIRHRFTETFQLRPVILLPYGKVGDRWSVSAHSRDENHDSHDYEIKQIYSVGS